MKQNWMLFFLLSAALTVAACGDSDEDNTSQPQPEKTLLPVTKYYTTEEFNVYFSNRTWAERLMYSVYADGTVADKPLILDGNAPTWMDVHNDNTLNWIVLPIDPTDDIYNTQYPYSLGKGNKFQIGDDKVFKSMTVIEINDTLIRLLDEGKFYKEPNEKGEMPVATLYRFHPKKTLLPITKYYSEKEFNALFANHEWFEWQIHNVYEDGTISDWELLRNIDGYAPMDITVYNDNTLNVRIEYEDPGMEDHNQVSPYIFLKGNTFRFGKDNALWDCYRSPLTVLEINDTIVRFLGNPFHKGADRSGKTPAASLFLFHRR